MIPVTKQTSLSSALLNSDFYEVRRALLSGIPQVEVDLAITINATRLQPELLYQPRQPQVSMMPP